MNDGGIYILIVAAMIGLVWLNVMGKRRQKAALAFRDNLRPGMKVMTTSGMFATVVSEENERVILADQSGSTSEWLKVAIARVDEEGSEELTSEDHAPDSPAITEATSDYSAPQNTSGLLSEDDVRRLGRDN